MAHAFLGRFDNVHDGEGIVDNGMVRALPRQPIDQMAKILIGMKQEMIDKLSVFDEMGIDRIILNVNFGCDPHETLDAQSSISPRKSCAFFRQQGRKHPQDCCLITGFSCWRAGW